MLAKAEYRCWNSSNVLYNENTVNDLFSAQCAKQSLFLFNI